MTRSGRRARLAEAGDWLRQRREARGLTQQQLGARLDVGKSVISNYEGGITAPRDDAAERLATALGLPLLELRRRFGLWVPDQEQRPLSTLEAAELDPALDDEARRHLREQYRLLIRLAKYRRESTDDEVIREVQRRYGVNLRDFVRPSSGAESASAPRRDDVTREGESGETASRPA